MVFSRFPGGHDHGAAGSPDRGSKWQSWQVLFLLEGGLAVVVAVVGYSWLPHSVDVARFLSPEEREYSCVLYASSRVIRDCMAQSSPATQLPDGADEEREDDDESRGLLNPS
ncbi:hypothetical protein BCR34DRAFT_606022 [Clohesyomyces aquaticus]|uniref:Uncharacterized protein n=1 Tax=Clohesyomyces aquaticus TaxID=1231657 RepID=A0A1Y1YT18_9PLEO|nr:hypothetical protein BCR34DRAFT_606022 [Clohesyomyces aquaticus]